MKILWICLFFVFAFGFAYSQSICIDAGHGGSDPGALGNGIEEKNINLDVALRLANLMRASGWKVYMTRTSDQTVSLSSRTSYANNVGVQRFVSIHCNAFNHSAHGTETYCYGNGSSISYSMRNRVQAELLQVLGTYDRGCKTADFYVLKYTNMPAILCELAFIDNPGDAAKLTDANYRQKAAEAIKRAMDATLTAEDMVTTQEVSFRQNEEIVLTSEDGTIWLNHVKLSDELDTYFNPKLSPNKEMVVYEGLVTGIHVCDIFGKNHFYLGKGNNPYFSSDSQKIFFECSEEKDHQIVSTDLYEVDIASPKERIKVTKIE